MKTNESSVPHTNSNPPLFGFPPWVWAAMAFPLLSLLNGRWAVALAAWIAPAVFLRFTRHAKPTLVAVGGLLVMACVYYIQFGGALDEIFPPAQRAVVSIIFGGFQLLPYLADRWVQRSSSLWVRVFMFPATWATVEFVVAKGPFGSLGASAYSQIGVDWIVQLASLTGLWGIVFLLGWFASVVELIVDARGIRNRNVKYHSTAVAACIVAVFVFGTTRVLTLSGKGSTYRIAGIAPHPAQYGVNMWGLGFQKTLSDGDHARATQFTQTTLVDLFDNARRQIKDGARLIVWPETGLQLLKQDEPAVLTQIASFARENHITILAGLGEVNPGASKPMENRALLISESGEIQADYHKSNLVPGPEKMFTVTGSPSVPVAATPVGKVGTAICFDADFPPTVRSAAPDSPTLIALPSNDWNGIDPWHTQMASMRAIEMGCSVFRECSNGLSAAYDLTGKLIAQQDYFRSVSYSLVADVPYQTSTTLYSQIGDAFAWSACILAAAILVVSIVGPKREKQ